jgi:hypothetical protein
MDENKRDEYLEKRILDMHEGCDLDLEEPLTPYVQKGRVRLANRKKPRPAYKKDAYMQSDCSGPGYDDGVPCSFVL